LLFAITIDSFSPASDYQSLTHKESVMLLMR